VLMLLYKHGSEDSQFAIALIRPFLLAVLLPKALCHLVHVNWPIAGRLFWWPTITMILVINSVVYGLVGVGLAGVVSALRKKI